MRTLADNEADIERLSTERASLRRQLSTQPDPQLRAQTRALDTRLEDLWQEQRTLRAQLRFGDHAQIIARSRVEERLERELTAA